MLRALLLLALLLLPFPSSASEGSDVIQLFGKTRQAVAALPDPGDDAPSASRAARALELLDVGLVDRALALLGPDTDALEGELDYIVPCVWSTEHRPLIGILRSWLWHFAQCSVSPMVEDDTIRRVSSSV